MVERFHSFLLQRRLYVLLVAAILTGVGVPLIGAPPASADADGCTQISGGYTCTLIQGGGLHVNTFQQSKGHVSKPPQNCNYYARFTVSKDGREYWSGRTDVHQGCDNFPRVTRRLTVNRDFEDGSRACGSWFENDSRMGTTCLDVHR